MIAWFRHSPLRWIIPIFLLLCVYYNATFPLLDGNDEDSHYVVISQIASQRKLIDLNDPPSYEATQPPFYHVLGALAVGWLDLDTLTNPNHNALPIRLLRWLSSLIGAVMIWATYQFAHTLFASAGSAQSWQRQIATLATVLLAFNPKFISLSAQINNDILSGCFATLTFWLAARMMHTPNPKATQWLRLGACAGLSFFAKYSGVAMILAVAFAALWLRGGYTFIKAGVLAAVGFLGINTPMFVYNLWRYGNPIAWQQMLVTNGTAAHPAPLTFVQLLSGWWLWLTSYWGHFGVTSVSLPDGVYRVLFGLMWLAVLGVMLAVVRRELPREMAILVLPSLLSLALFMQWMSQYNSSFNSRLMLLTYPVAAILTASGWLSLGQRFALGLPRLRLRYGLGVLCGGCVAYAFIAPLLSFYPVLDHEDARYLSADQINTLPNSGRVQFDNGVELLGANLSQNRIAPNDNIEISLIWRATYPIDRVYRIGLAAYDAQDRLLGRIDEVGYPTSSWKTGRALREDFRLPIRDIGFAPNQPVIGRIMLEWYQHREPFTRARVQNKPDSAVQVGQIRLRLPLANEAAVKSPIARFGDDIVLAAYTRVGDTLNLQWLALGEPRQNYTVFVHGLDAQGKVIGQADAPFTQASAFWLRGEVLNEARIVPNLQQAAQIRIGVYDAISGARLAAFDGNGLPQPDRALLISN